VCCCPFVVSCAASVVVLEEFGPYRKEICAQLSSYFGDAVSRWSDKTLMARGGYLYPSVLFVPESSTG